MVWPELSRRLSYWEITAVFLSPVVFCVPRYLAAHEHRPPVGVYVTILGVLAAAVAFRKDPPAREKALWILVFTFLMFAEITNLFAADREQAATFSSISQSLEGTRKGLEVALTGLKVTTTKLTGISDNVSSIVNHSDIQLQKLLDTQFKPDMTNIVPLAVSQTNKVNVSFVNAGSVDSTLDGFLFKTYIARPDNSIDQRALASRFDREWAKTIHSRGLSVVSPGTQGFQTGQTDPLLQGDVKEIQEGKKSIYFFIRFAFSDKSGVWLSDYCFDTQQGASGYQAGVTHSCLSNYNRHHYRRPKERKIDP